MWGIIFSPRVDLDNIVPLILLETHQAGFVCQILKENVLILFQWKRHFGKRQRQRLHPEQPSKSETDQSTLSMHPPDTSHDSDITKETGLETAGDDRSVKKKNKKKTRTTWTAKKFLMRILIPNV